MKNLNKIILIISSTIIFGVFLYFLIDYKFWLTTGEKFFEKYNKTALAEFIGILKNINKSKEFEKEVLKDLPKDSELIKISKVENVGYVFYLGKVDKPTNNNISEAVKNEMTQAFYDSRFPKKLLNNIVFLIINTLEIKPNQFVYFNNNTYQVSQLDPVFLKGGGMYSQQNEEDHIVYINKNLVEIEMSPAVRTLVGPGEFLDPNFKSVLLHELGHILSNKLTSNEWKEYYNIRNISENTPRYNQPWNQSPNEDFAEVYSSIFTGEHPKTVYGVLIQMDYVDYGSCADIAEAFVKANRDKYIKPMSTYKNYLDYMQAEKDLDLLAAKDPKVQACRRQAIIKGTGNYISTVGQKEIDFINKILNKK